MGMRLKIFDLSPEGVEKVAKRAIELYHEEKANKLPRRDMREYYDIACAEAKIETSSDAHVALGRIVGMRGLKRIQKLRSLGVLPRTDESKRSKPMTYTRPNVYRQFVLFGGPVSTVDRSPPIRSKRR